MTSGIPSPPTAKPDMAITDLRWAILAWGLFALLLVTNVPLFLCMPLNDDAALYDLQAANLLQGGVLYRDIFEANLPGIVWLQAAVRSLLGSSSVALRAADLVFVAAAIWLLARWLKSGGVSSAGLAIATFAWVLYYFSTTEWCHCQRDVWLVVPGLAGLTLRRRRLEYLCSSRRTFTETGRTNETMPGSLRGRVGPAFGAAEAGVAGVGWSAFCEGMCWGAGVWLKPMIVVPAALCWIFSAFLVRHWRKAAADFVGLVSGALFVGGIGVAWLVWSGAWPSFLQTLIEWNPRYVAAGREHWTAIRYVAMQYRFFPWQLIHLAAVPAALITVGRGVEQWWKSRKDKESKREEAETCESAIVEESGGQSGEPSASSTSRIWDSSTFRPSGFSSSSLLATFYLGWLVQSYALQHLFDYVHAAEVLLAIGVLAGVRPGRGWRLAVAGFLALAVVTSPAVRLERLSCWRECLVHGTSAERYDRLRLLPMTEWQDLERVRKYVSGLGSRNGELTCFHNGLVHLYCQLGFRPSTRYVFLESLSVYYPDRHDVFLQALSVSPQRYVVSDLRALGVTMDDVDFCPEGALATPARFPWPLRRAFPWSQPVVFRAGQYLVHRVEGPLGTLERQAGWPTGNEPSEGEQPRANDGTKQGRETSTP